MIDEQKIELAMPYSKAGVRRLRATWQCCEDTDCRQIPGAFVECGVWRGGNAMVARWASPSRQCWLYDTFSGMTEPGENDAKRNGKVVGEEWIGKSAAAKTEVLTALHRVGVWDPSLFKIVVGDVRKTLRFAANLPGDIAVLRLDTDFYDSTKAELEVLYPRLSPGGYLLIDDYGHWMGAKKAVDDYLGKQAKALTLVDYTCAWMMKP